LRFVLPAESTPVDLVIIVDTSVFTNTSESFDREFIVKGFISSLLENADIDSGAVKVALVTFNTHPTLAFGLDKYWTRQDVQEQVFLSQFDSEDATRERNIADALSLVRTKVLARDRQEAPNVVMLLTTGKSNRNSGRTLQEADALKMARANIFAIGVGVDEDGAEEMYEIASKPTMDTTFRVEQFSELELIPDLIYRAAFNSKSQLMVTRAA